MKRYEMEWHRDGGCSMDEWEEGDYVRYEDVADLEHRYREALDLIQKLRGGVERYSSDLCREADQFLDDACLTGRYTD